MAQAVAAPSTILSPPRTIQIIHRFDELPLFREIVDGVAWIAGRTGGEFEVSFDHTGDWWISDLWIDADNGRFGPDARGKRVQITVSEHPQLHVSMLDTIEATYSTRIDEWIADECAARGLRVAA